jgi:hypothetical protein
LRRAAGETPGPIGGWRGLAAFIVGGLLALAPFGAQLIHLGEHTRIAVLPRFEADLAFTAKAIQVARDSADHFARIAGWLFGYGGWPLVLLVATAGGLTLVRRDRGAAALAGAWLLALLIDSLAYPQPYARYLLASQIPLALFSAGHSARRGATVLRPARSGGASFSPPRRSP